ncbi:MAG: tRNA lysidine(34) synthetase TilS [Oscillospiraceae bacterium]|nr:tRNA lysidine(34) synthetase TilS [Oscillospiraceae bacterium]
MINHVIKTIEKFNMLNKGDSVAVALSGGADSVCLLLSLVEISKQLDISVSAIHVNHCLRGIESDNDEIFCHSLCKNLGVKLISNKFDVSGYAQKNKLSTEQAARDIRYAFFEENTRGMKLATAHNANDNAETVIFNLARGTGLKGISGIPPVRDNIIRPLIETTRSQIEEYLLQKNQNFVTDKTNLTDDYTRNKIRHNVIPVLLSVNSSLFRTITTDSENFRTDNDFIEQYSSEIYEKCKTQNGLTGLNNCHTSIRRRCISKYLRENNIEVSHRCISDVEKLCKVGGKINICKDTYIIFKDNILRILHTTAEKSSDDVLIPVKPGINKFKQKNVVIAFKSIIDRKQDTINIDADKIRGNAVIRNRRPGDRIKLFGNSFTSSVKKVFNSKFPQDERDNICFIADDEGPLFIENVGIAERAMITECTKNIIEISIHCV